MERTDYSPTSRQNQLRRSTAWFLEARSQKEAARKSRQCVECRTELPSRRTPYCSRRCRWRFQGHYFWDAARTYVLHRDRFRCRQCGSRFRVRELEVDHILEIGRGGAPLDYENLQTLCRSCHREKTRRFLRTRVRPGAPNGSESRSFDPSEPAEAAWFPA
ncbi:MAG: HNH endonuclease signature motif containing protein [Thermoplasmata archaeon]